MTLEEFDAGLLALCEQLCSAPILLDPHTGGMAERAASAMRARFERHFRDVAGVSGAIDTVLRFDPAERRITAEFWDARTGTPLSQSDEVFALCGGRR